MSCRVIQVIETELTKRGLGSLSDPVRNIKQYWSLDGELLAEVDIWEKTFNEAKKSKEEK